MGEASPRVLLIIPGFLTEKGLIARELEGTPLGSIDPTQALDGRAWYSAIASIVHEDVQVELFEWGSLSVETLLLRLLSVRSLPQRWFHSIGGVDPKWLHIAREIFELWSAVYDECEQAAVKLRDKIEEYPPSAQIYLVGHSLGGRIIMKTAQSKLSRLAPLKMSAWAPAMNQDVFDWEAGVKLRSPPEIVFSRDDLILKMLFPLGQVSQENRAWGEIGGETNWKPRLLRHLVSAIRHSLLTSPIGCSGPPIEALYPCIQDLPGQELGHLDYLHKIPMIFQRSIYLSELCQAPLSSPLV